MRPKDPNGNARRKIVTQRLREFFAYVLGRFSGNSAELFDRAQKGSTALDQPSKRPPEK
jgi:hypothetical protein